MVPHISSFKMQKKKKTIFQQSSTNYTWPLQMISSYINTQ